MYLSIRMPVSRQVRIGEEQIKSYFASLLMTAPKRKKNDYAFSNYNILLMIVTGL